MNELTKKKRARCPRGQRYNVITNECDPATSKEKRVTEKMKTYRTTSRHMKTKKIKIFNESIQLKHKEEENEKNKKWKEEHNNETEIQKEERLQKLNLKHFICSDSGTCMAFGIEKKEINKLFNNFIDFVYANPRIKRIGAISANGFITQIEYDTNIHNKKLRSYKSYAILKSSMSRTADNLYYEYLVGQYFINKQSEIFPCFLETYGFYTYNSEDNWNTIKKIKGDENIQLNKLLTLHNGESSLDKACKTPKMMSILIENVKDARSLASYLKEDPMFFLRDLLGILFQIYMPLSQLSKTFTHYDLHTENVLLYEPFGKNSNKYITFNYYNSKNELTTFKSKYLVKIIDYGRSYFNNGVSVNSKTIYTKLCKTNECNSKITYDEPDYDEDDEYDDEYEVEGGGGEEDEDEDEYDYARCGDDSGFSWLSLEPNNEDSHYINSIRHNMSHDLRILKMINDGKFLKLHNSNTISIVEKYVKTPIEFQINQIESQFLRELFSVLSKTVYETDYGTKEVVKSSKKKIQNVNDAYYQFTKLIKSEGAKIINDKYYNNVSLENGGYLHIYTNKPMQFIEPNKTIKINELDTYTMKKIKSPNTLKIRSI